MILVIFQVYMVENNGSLTNEGSGKNSGRKGKEKKEFSFWYSVLEVLRYSYSNLVCSWTVFGAQEGYKS